ncbi:acetamidase [Aspergillus terreus]|uniref:Acetamidase n=1 Tax=Aspergillus terreus TaxID=33178 RepID=A0A5M3Z8J0_ASPTE|nr:hypothetical protein ATETN484_0011043000 [Aspergillus terreus]GFF19072.1 acetamidase [Aspergillus terreus]
MTPSHPHAQPPEILVHIAAPSSLRDDVRYRAQVDALLAFQPLAASRQRIPVEPSADSARSGESSRLQPQGLPHELEDDSPVSVIPDSQPDAAIPTDTDLAIVDISLSNPSTSASASASASVSRIDSNDTTKQDAAGAQNTEKGPSVSLSQLPLQIQSPLPPISTAAFTSHITPTLAMLATRLRSARTYTPLHQTRPLDKLERGHWFVPLTLVEDGVAADPNTWDMVFFARFWSFLSDFITEQRAGWGVWCILEEAPAVPANGPACSLRNTVLKVYAWGEIAAHIYLLLFLASERRIRKMGAQWRDGADQVVIQMPSYTSSLVKNLAEGD